MKKILLVEDNETIIMGLKYSLEQEGFQVISAKTAKESKEKLDNYCKCNDISKKTKRNIIKDKLGDYNGYIRNKKCNI